MLEKIKKYLLADQKNKKILITVGWVSAVLLILIIAASTGGVTAGQTDMNSTAEFNISEMVFGTLIRLVLVLALIYGLFSIYRLFQKNAPGIRERRLKIIDTHRFSAKQAIVLVSVDQQELLIGLTDHQISLLKDLGQPNAGDQGMVQNPENKMSFKEIMEAQDEK